MSRFRQSTENLGANLLAVLSGSPSPAQLKALVRTSHALALMLLRMKRSSGLARVSQGISESDLAYDCIADLFRRGEDGAFVGLRAYFGSLDLAGAEDADLLVYLRRLVSSAVNQGIFRVYNEIDPTLGKILRNIKLSIQGLKNFTEVEIFGEPCISPILCDPLAGRLPFDRDELLRRLMMRVRGTEKTPEMLAALSHLLRGQDEFSRVVPLIVVANTFRDVYARKSIQGHVSEEVEAHASGSEIIAALEEACSNVKSQTEAKYVGQGKISRDLFDSYFAAITDYLRTKLDGGWADISLYTSLNRVAPHIGNAEYRLRHRARMEYLARIVREQTLRQLER